MGEINFPENHEISLPDEKYYSRLSPAHRKQAKVVYACANRQDAIVAERNPKTVQAATGAQNSNR
jgi:hypothetical protein